LAIYVADLQTQQLRHIIAGYALPITCMDWSPDKPNLLVCASTDKTVSVWDVETESTLYTLSLDSPPILVQWCRGDPEKIAIASENGTVRLWQPVASNSLVSRDFNFSKVAVLRWNVKIACLLAAGHADCSITIYNSASQSPHRIKCADSKYGGQTSRRTQGAPLRRQMPVVLRMAYAICVCGHVLRMAYDGGTSPVTHAVTH
jgi:WD40 repeat protein